MTAAGFQWFVELPPVVAPTQDYGVTRTPAKGTNGPNEKYVSSLSPETSEAYSQNLRICIGRTNESIDRGQPNSERVPALLELKRTADAAVAADPAVIAAIHQWSACMRSAGWRFESPTEPSREILAQFNTLDPLSQAMTPNEDTAPITRTDPTVAKAKTLVALRDVEARVFKQDRKCAARGLTEVTTKTRQKVEGQLVSTL